MKRNSRKKKRPMVPKNIEQSQIVGEYMPHDEGRKSRCRLDEDDDEALEPHADVDEDRDDEEHQDGCAGRAEPDQLRHDDVADNQSPVEEGVRPEEAVLRS